MPTASQHQNALCRKRVRQLNDAFRTSLQGGKVVLASSVQALPDSVLDRALSKLRSYDDFTRANDPFGEHEYGRFELAGKKFFWTIEAFDKELRYASDDPSDPERTTRVLTLTLAP